MSKRPASNRLLLGYIRKICRGSALSLPAATLLGLGTITTVMAEPTGGIVVSGQGTISTPAVGTTLIDQGSQQLQLNWDTFNVGANEQVRFQQPSSSAVAINRILDQNPSQIFGRIDANGQVVLVNPNGMLFGSSAQLNVGSLVASSLDVTGVDADGRYTFGTARNNVGAIVNDGSITATAGGSVTLLGGRVANNGSIVANLGTVNLAAGRAATLDLAGDGLLQLQVDSQLLANESGASDAVANSGTIQANGGQVLLSAKALDGVFANLVNNTGVVRASRIENHGGTIRLIGNDGTVRSSGTLDASSGDAASTGGRIEVLGDRVGLSGNALVDVSGATGGGTALIGGDFQGNNADVLNASRTYIGADAVIDASAGSSGDGGKVIVWADEFTRFDGHIEARGGTSSGNGGFAEVSGKNGLAFTGTADLRATHGIGGTLLLDPMDITIINSNDPPGPAADGTYEFGENAGAAATIGNQTIETLLINTGSVMLQATRNIVQNADASIDVSSDPGAAGRSLTLMANTITLNGDIFTNGGMVHVSTLADGATPGGDITLAGTISSGIVSVIATGDGDLVMSSGSQIHASDAVSLFAARDVTLTGVTAANTASVMAGGSIRDDGIDFTGIVTDNLALNAGSAIGQSGSGTIDTNVYSLTAQTSTGGIYINEIDDVVLGNVTAQGGGSVHIRAQGDIESDSVTAADAVTLDSAFGSIFVGTVNAPTSVTLQALNGEILDDLMDSTRISTAALSMTANGGIGTGFLGSIDTQVQSLTASSLTNDIHIDEVDGLTLSSVTATSGGGDIQITSAFGGIAVATVTATNSVTLNTSGAIVDDGNDSTRINANSLSLTGNTIGASSTSGQIDTTVGTLTLTSTGNVYLRETDAVQLLTLAAFGGETVIANGFGNLTVGDVMTFGSLRLDAENGSIFDDGNLSTRIRANALDLRANSFIGSGSGFASIATTVGSLSATSTFGDIFITEADGLTLTNVGTQFGSTIDVRSDNGDITVGTVGLNPSTNVMLTAASGSILDDGNDATRIGGSLLRLWATGNIGATGTSNQIDTAVSSLELQGANIYVGESNAVSLVNVATSGNNHEIVIANDTGDITVNTVSAANNDVSLIAHAGSIVDDGNSGSVITARELQLQASNSIGMGASLVTQVDTLRAAAANGNVRVNTSGPTVLADIQASGTGSNIEVTGDSTLTLGDLSASDAITLTGTAILDDGNDATRVTTDLLQLLSTTGGIGTAGTGALDTTIGSLQALSAGSLFIREADGLTLSEVVATNASHIVDIASDTGDILVVDIFTPTAVALTATNGAILDDLDDTTTIATDQLTLSAATDIGSNTNPTGAIDTDVGTLSASSGGSAYLSEANDITLQNVSAADEVSLLALNGSIFDDGDDATWLTAHSAMLTSDVAIGGASAHQDLDTSVDLLTAQAGQLIAIRELDGITLTDLSSSDPGGTVDVTALAGEIVVGSIFAVDSVTLDALTGGISDDGDDTSVIYTEDATLRAASHVGTVLDFGAALDADVGSTMDLATSTLNVVVASNTGEINLDLSNASPDLSGVDITLGNGSGRAGEIVLQTRHDLQLDTLAAGAIDIGSANTTSVGLRAGGTVVLPSGGDFTDQPAAHLLVRGAIDVVDSDLQPRDLSLSAGQLDFHSGSAGGATTLHTSASLLNATIDNHQNLIVNELDGLSLGNIDVGTGDFTLTAGGAASDDGNDATRIVATNTSLSASSLGAVGNELNTQVSSLTANATSGGIFIRETDAVALTANATGGAVDVRTANGALTVMSATGDGVALTAGGVGSNIVWDGLINAGNDDITLTAGDANDGDIVLGASNIALGAALNVTATSLGTSTTRLNSALGTLNVTATGGGIYVNESDALELNINATGSVDVRTIGGALTVTSAMGDGVSLVAGGDGSGITLNGAVAAGSGDVTMTAGSMAQRGAIVANANSQVSGNSLIALGSSVGSSTAQLVTSVNQLDATATNGGIFINEADALQVNANATGAVDVRTANGALTVASATGDGVSLVAGGDGNGIALNGAVSAGSGDVTMSAGSTNARGAIAASPFALVTAASLTAVASSIGTSTERLSMSADTLHATATDGGIFVFEADSLSLAANATGAVEVATLGGELSVASVSGGSIQLQAIGADSNLTVNGDLSASAGNVNLFATGNITSSAAISATDGVMLFAGNDLVVDATVAAGDGDVLLAANGSLTLNDEVTSSGMAMLVAFNDVSALGSITASGDISVITSGGDITLNQATTTAGNAVLISGAGHDIHLLGNLDAGAGQVALGAGTAEDLGAITGSAGHRISGSTVTMFADSIGTLTERIETSAETVNANSGAGGIYLTETDALNLAAVTTGPVDVRTQAGSITVFGVIGNEVALQAGGTGSSIALNGSIDAGTGNVTLTALNGEITDDGDDATLIVGNTLTLAARSIGARSTLTGTELDSSMRLDTDVTSLSATASAGGIFIDQLQGLQSVRVQASGGASGDIELLTRAGDLNLVDVRASDQLLLAAGRDILASPGATIAANVAELRAGTTDLDGGRIGTTDQPLRLQLSAGESLRLFVPQAIDPQSSNGPAFLAGQDVTTTVSWFNAPDELAANAGFGQFEGFDTTSSGSGTELQLRTLQGQASRVVTTVGFDFGLPDPEVQLFETSYPAVCMPMELRTAQSTDKGC